jgi:hypothetical protein
MLRLPLREILSSLVTSELKEGKLDSSELSSEKTYIVLYHRAR